MIPLPTEKQPCLGYHVLLAIFALPQVLMGILGLLFHLHPDLLRGLP